MSDDSLRVGSHGELIAVIPHLLGFNPSDSLVCVPLQGGAPVARVDHPHAYEDTVAAVSSLRSAYGRYPDLEMAVVAFTDDDTSAQAAVDLLRAALADTARIRVELVTSGETFRDLSTGTVGWVSPGDSARMAAERTFRGSVQPLRSRDDLVRSLRGDPRGVLAHLPGSVHTVEQAGEKSLTRESDWVSRTVRGFCTDQRALDDRAAARLLVAVQTPEARDAALVEVTRDTARTHVALWQDLVRRSPAQVRPQAAALLAFSAWMAGDGARAWVALGLIPADAHVPLAGVVTTALDNAIAPRDFPGIAADRQSYGAGRQPGRGAPAPRRPVDRGVPRPPGRPPGGQGHVRRDPPQY